MCCKITYFFYAPGFFTSLCDCFHCLGNAILYYKTNIEKIVIEKGKFIDYNNFFIVAVEKIFGIYRKVLHYEPGQLKREA